MLNNRPTILVVDDEAINIDVIQGILENDGYRVLVAKTGDQAVQRARSQPQPDLILLDIMMPGLDGHEVCRRLKADSVTTAIPVIFVTAMAQEVDEAYGFELGAVDYITKPLSPPLLRARVRNHLQLKQARDILFDLTDNLARMVADRTRELSVTRDVTILSLATLADIRDNETGNHIRRTQNYVRLLAETLRFHPEFATELDDQSIDILVKSAPLHDIGKVGIPDHILLKPGRLDPAEFEIMKTHARLGYEAIMVSEGALINQGVVEGESSFLRCAREIARHHHERWDGTGYPDGLAGDAIPLSARLMALADVYDALISRRPYKRPFSHEQTVELIQKGAGSHFDPRIVAAFNTVAGAFADIARTLADPDPVPQSPDPLDIRK